jgi:hypothetical protein
MVALRLISKAYEEQDRQSTSAYSAKLRERKERKHREYQEAVLMKEEDVLALHHRDFMRRLKFEAAAAIRAKEMEERLEREIEERLAQEDGEPTTFAAKQRAIERRRKIEEDKLNDIKRLARNGGEQNYATVLSYVMGHSLKNILELDLIPSIQECSKAKWQQTQYTLLRIIEQYFQQLRSLEPDSDDDSDDDEVPNRNEMVWNSLLEILKSSSKNVSSNEDMLHLLINIWTSFAGTMYSREGLRAFVSMGGVEALHTISSKSMSMKILESCGTLVEYYSAFDCGGSLNAKIMLEHGALEICDILVGNNKMETQGIFGDGIDDTEVESEPLLTRNELEGMTLKELKTIARANGVEPATAKSIRESWMDVILNALAEKEKERLLKEAEEPEVTPEANPEDESVQRHLRENVLFFLCNLSRHKSANVHMVSKGAISIVCRCLQWDRYNSRNPSESDLFILLGINTISQMLFCLPDHKRPIVLLDLLKNHDPTKKKLLMGDQLDEIIAYVLDRTGHIASELQTSTTKIETILEIRQACLKLIEAHFNIGEEGIKVWQRHSKSLKRMIELIIPMEISSLNDRMPEQAKTPRGLTNRQMRNFLRQRRRAVPTQETLQFRQFIADYEHLLAVCKKLQKILSKYQSGEMDNLLKLNREIRDANNKKNAQEKLVAFVKRHSELFRVHYHSSSDKRNEGMTMLLDGLERIAPSTKGFTNAAESALPTLRDNWQHGIKHLRMCDAYARVLFYVSKDPDASARILRLGIGSQLIHIVRGEGTAPKRWYWIATCFANISEHPRLRNEFIKCNGLAAVVACCQLAHSHGSSSPDEGEESHEEREKVENMLDVTGQPMSGTFFTWEEKHLNKKTCGLVSLTIERLSTAKSTRSWMISKGVMLPLDRLVSLSFSSIILKGVATSIHNLVEESQAARLATREGVMLILFKLWKLMCSVRVVAEIDEGAVTDIKQQTKGAIFRIASHRCIEALDQIVNLAQFARYPEERELICSCSKALETYSLPPRSMLDSQTALLLVRNPKFLVTMQRLASFKDESVLRSLAQVGRNISKFEEGQKILSHPHLVYCFECLQNSSDDETKLIALAATLHVNENAHARQKSTISLLRGMIKSINS